jgi:hypothetical protein
MNHTIPSPRFVLIISYDNRIMAMIRALFLIVNTVEF